MFLESIQEKLWLLFFLPLYFLCGISLLACCRLLPLRCPVKIIRLTFGRKQGGNRGPSPSQAASTALASTVGIGNIIGTAQAIAMGGPGAVFWLWAAALLGMMIKYAEILHGIRTQGGAMTYIREALGRVPAAFYAVIAILSTLTVGNMAQMNGAVNALCGAAGGNGSALKIVLGAGMTAFLGACLSGGAGRVGEITGKCIPFMTAAYLILTGSLVAAYGSRLISTISLIFAEAFRPRSAAGAACGITLRQALLWGLRRGAFSHEAGLGTAANIHAFSDDREPKIHALWGIVEVFADTMVICTLTALAILCSGIRIPYGTLPGAELLERALSLRFGLSASRIYLSIALFLFGMSTVIGCYVSGAQCAAGLLGKNSARCFFVLYLICAFLGCVFPMEMIWETADVLNVLMACPNLFALLILSSKTGEEARGLIRREDGKRLKGQNRRIRQEKRS